MIDACSNQGRACHIRFCVGVRVLRSRWQCPSVSPSTRSANRARQPTAPRQHEGEGGGEWGLNRPPQGPNRVLVSRGPAAPPRDHGHQFPRDPGAPVRALSAACSSRVRRVSGPFAGKPTSRGRTSEPQPLSGAHLMGSVTRLQTRTTRSCKRRLLIAPQLPVHFRQATIFCKHP